MISTGIFSFTQSQANVFDFTAFVYIYFAFTSLVIVVDLCTLLHYEVIGPLQDPVTWYGINYTGKKNGAVGLSKQRKVTLDCYEFLCFGSPTASFASQCNLFHTM